MQVLKEIRNQPPNPLIGRWCKMGVFIDFLSKARDDFEYMKFEISGYIIEIDSLNKTIDNRNILIEKLQNELKRLMEIALSTDKRASISAIQEIFKLKDKYPASKSKIMGLFEKVGD